MARDINNVIDDVSLVIRESIEATENAVVLQIGSNLNKGSKSKDIDTYIKKQKSSKIQFNKKLKKLAKKSIKQMDEVANRVGQYTGADTKSLKKEIRKGMKMLVKSSNDFQNQALKKISRLGKFTTSAALIPDLKKSIIQQLKIGIDKGLPVTYKSGKKMNYKSYMEMAVRTGVQTEIGNTQLDAGANANIVFWLVNEFRDCADDHAAYQGKMYYDERYMSFNLTDEIKTTITNHIKSRNLLSIQEVRDKPPFLTTRPNCRHKIKAIAIDQVLTEGVDVIKDKVGYKSESYRPKDYQATKQQRLNERNIRKYKQREATYQKLYKETGDAEYLNLAQKSKKQTRAWQSRQREHVKKNPFLFRDYERENTKVLLQDLGLSKKVNLSRSQDIEDHLNLPDQNL